MSLLANDNPLPRVTKRDGNIERWLCLIFSSYSFALPKV